MRITVIKIFLAAVGIFFVTLYLWCASVTAPGMPIVRERAHTVSRREERVFECTAYTLGECGKPPGHPLYGITASGVPAQIGVTVAAGPEIPFGTVLEIEGVGVRIVQDRGAAIGNGQLDIFMGEGEEAVEEAMAFGRQWLRVRVVE